MSFLREIILRCLERKIESHWDRSNLIIVSTTNLGEPYSLYPVTRHFYKKYFHYQSIKWNMLLLSIMRKFIIFLVSTTIAIPLSIEKHFGISDRIVIAEWLYCWIIKLLLFLLLIFWIFSAVSFWKTVCCWIIGHLRTPYN